MAEIKNLKLTEKELKIISSILPKGKEYDNLHKKLQQCIYSFWYERAYAANPDTFRTTESFRRKYGQKAVEKHNKMLKMKTN